MADQPTPTQDRALELLQEVIESSKRVEYFFAQQEKVAAEELEKDEQRRALQLEAQKALVDRHERAIAAEERQADALERIAAVLELYAGKDRT
jgi:hypothetical protein